MKTLKNFKLKKLVFVIPLILIFLSSLVTHYVLALADDEIDLSVTVEDAWSNWTAISQYSGGALQYPGQWSLEETERYIVNAENTDNMTGFYNPTVNYSDMNISIDIGAWNGDDDYLGVMIRFSEDENHNCYGYIFMLPGSINGYPSTETRGGGLYKLTGQQFNYNNLVKIAAVDNVYWTRYEWKTVNIVAKGNKIIVTYDGVKVVDVTDTSINQGSYGFFSISQPQARFTNIIGVATLAHYNVKFDPNGGTLSGASSKDVISTRTYGTLPTASRTGYDFAGWYTAPSGGSRIISTSTVTISSDTTLYAHWIPHVYTIQYNGNGNTSGSMTNSNHTYDVPKALSNNGFLKQYNVTFNHNYTGVADTVKTASYTLKGWATTSTGTAKYSPGQQVSNLSSVNGAIVNLYAVWSPTSVSYIPTRPGYTFLGWFTNAACTGTRVDDVNGKYTPTKDTTLYAKWQAHTYIVKYDGNGSTSGSTADSNHTYDVARSLTKNGYERRHTVTYNHNYLESTNISKTSTYKFNGWSETATGDKKYNDQATVSNLTTGNDTTVTLYANWSSETLYYTPTREGYTFEGWFTNGACSGTRVDVDGAYIPTQNVTLYAKWRAHTYLINYHGTEYNEGSMEPSSHTYDVPKKLNKNGFEQNYTVTYVLGYDNLPNVDKVAKYKMDGWATTPTGNAVYKDEESVLNLSSKDQDIIDLYAKWSKTSINYIPERTGYTFLGWYTDSNYTEPRVDTDGVYTPTEDTTLYAKWIINIYSYQKRHIFEGVENLNLRETGEAEYLTVIDTYTDNSTYGWYLADKQNYPLTVTEKEDQNIMKIIYERKPAYVTVKYIDIYTGDEISERETISGKVFDKYNSDDVKKDISGYTLIEGPSPTTGTLTEEPQEKIYYYAYNTTVTVKYLEIDDTPDDITDNLAIIPDIVIEGYQKLPYRTEIKKIDNYTYIYNSENISGMMTRAPITVIYWYLQNTSVVVNHIDKITDEVLHTETIKGLVGDEYTSSPMEFEDYMLVRVPEKETIIMGKEVTVLNYYYIHTSKGVEVKYLDIDTGEMLEGEFILGLYQDTYSTEPIDIDGYEIVTNERYYKWYVANHPEFLEENDVETVNELLEKLGKNPHVIYIPDNQNGIMTKGLTEVLYYYRSKGQIKDNEITKESYDVLDERTDKITYTIRNTAKIASYKGDAKVTLVDTLEYPINTTESELNGGTYNPNNNTITWELDINDINTYESGIDIPYEVNFEKTITLLYENVDVEKDTITNKVKSTITLLDEEKEETKEISNEVEINVQGIVDVVYKDINTDEEISEKTEIKGRIGREFDLTENAKEIDNYTLLEKPIPITGKFEEATQEKTFYYAKNTHVVVRYMDKVNNTDIINPLTIEGYIGKHYETKPEEIEDYIYVTSTENTSGDMTEEIIEVIYYYNRKAEIYSGSITKVSDDVLTDRTDKITYDILYEAEVSYYTGETNVVIQDTLEYPINVEESNLDGGVYDPINKTITWEINLGIIDTYETGENVPYEVKILKKITLLYEDVDLYQDVIINNIKGSLFLIDEDVYNNSTDTEEVKINVKGIVNVLYVDKDTEEEIVASTVKKGKIGTEFDITDDVKIIEGYTLISEPVIKTGIYEEEPQEKIYLYAKNTKVIVNHIDINTDEILDTYEEIGYVGKEFTSTAKNFEKYVLVGRPEKETITMTEDTITLNYYYAHVSDGVIEKHIDIVSGDLLDNTLYEGVEGDLYKTISKEFEGYDIVTNERYYKNYIKENPEFLEENDVKTVDKLLEKLKLKAEDPYVPENAEGKMTRDAIEVEYFYIRKATVKVEYIDKLTGEIITDDKGNNSTEYINGYETDPYETKEKSFENYKLVEEMYPENAKGNMTKEEIIVKYYYIHKTGGVIVKHIDTVTNELIKEDKLTGYEEEEYKVEPAKIDGYDLVEEKLPKNSEGKMIADETIIVEYYYIRKIEVIVQYIDKETGLNIIDNSGDDSTAHIYGHEGDSYTTIEKKFDKYGILEEMYPENAKGTMAPIKIEDGTVDSIIYVKYYYTKVSGGVIEKHINVITGEVFEEKRFEGFYGDTYKTSPNEYEGFDIVEDKLPNNSKGTMTIDEIEVNYYYVRRVKLLVQYLEEGNNRRLAEDDKRVVHEGDNYTTNAKNIAGYTLIEDKLPSNREGTAGAEEITVSYYYRVSNNSGSGSNSGTTTNPGSQSSNSGSNSGTNGNSGSNSNTITNPRSNSTGNTATGNNTLNNTISNLDKNRKTDPESNLPLTGDMLPIVSISLIIVVLFVNSLQFTIVNIIKLRKKE